MGTGSQIDLEISVKMERTLKLCSLDHYFGAHFLSHRFRLGFMREFWIPRSLNHDSFPIEKKIHVHSN